MKRIILTIMSLLLIFIIMLSVLFYEPQELYDKEAKRFVAIVNPGTYYWARIKDGIEQADQDLGTFTKYSTFNRFDIQEQIRLLKKIDYMSVDGVITVGELSNEEVNALLENLRKKGMPVVLVDTDSAENTRDCYIGSDNYAAGVLAAEQIGREIGGTGEVAVFVSSLETGNQSERLKGFQDRVESYGEIELVAVKESQKDKTLIQENFKELLKEYPNLDAVFCAEATSSSQISLLMSSQSDSELIVVGFDNADSVVQSVKDGTFSATIVQKSFDMGYEAVETLLMLQEENADVPDKIYTDVVCAAEDNISEILSEQTGSRGGKK